ncbi:LOW QUALITY PROTEIN: platelet endothelial cell adhesion molecule-like [Seriola lalandi dorsalis]|uniref:LOW QUALITY PROTEIN: platelet endothelial cell adhesion molecule-like n=1 Tax=Seriola lalandi dorsalis TaxID=1841481 RepID=UPI000C6FC6B2|nr:LOW QUALITY PROTEIN: platelet endothelial cell adhesion molecule-like [Seriola lalandi dorsalis]
MDSRPPNLPLLLLLTSLLHFDTAQCATGESSYIIDAVGLTILPNKTVESGTPVTIRCQVKVSHTNIPNLTHTFQLKRDDVVIHSSTTAEDSVVYELHPARAADSGSYDCRVTVKDKSRTNSSQKLDVIGLQTPILYLNKTTFYEGDDFIATCGAPEEKGSLMFRFFQRFGNKKPEKMKQVAPTGNSSETTLVLRHAGNYSLYCDYVINLVSGTSPSDHSNEIQVEIEGVQISPSMNVLPSSNVTEGDLMEVVCKVNTSQEKVEVFLTKDSKVLKKARVSLNHRFIAKDSGKLVCKAERGNVQKETYKEITVQELFSKPRLTLEPADLFVGDHFKLTCSVSVYFPERIRNGTMKFSIYKDNNRLIPSQTFISISHPDRNGNYTCRAETTSLTHNVEKESQTLVVKAKIPVSKPVLSVVGGTLVLGKSFQLLCHSDTGTLPITYTLFYSGNSKEFVVVSNPGEQAIFNSPAILESSELQVYLPREKQSTQASRSRISAALLHSINIIEPVSVPKLTIVPSMGEVSEGQDATLTCSVKKGTPPIIFTWYHTEMKGALDLQTSKTLERSYFIQNVRGEHKGGYYCVSTNPANETKQSDTVMIRGVFYLQLIAVITAVNVFCAMKFKFINAGHCFVAIESDDQNSVTATEPQYKEVKTRQADPNGAPVETGTNTVYSEVRNSKQGVPEQADGQGSVEYAQLNHDTDHHGDHGEHTDHSVQDDHIDVIDNSVDTNTADHGE